MDIGASVIARLKQKSRGTGNSLQTYLQLFCQEEFLRRLSLSKYNDSLVLKGGLFIYTLTNFESRATIDVDFLLRRFPGTIENMREIISEIVGTDTGNSFVRFESKGYVHITPQKKYQGISFQMLGYIKNTRTPFNVDIGIGDIIVPGAEKRSIPVQLPGFDAPLIYTYSLESTVAEKLDAILQRMELTSRMKDFYDIWYLSSTFGFEGRQLQEAVAETLQNRGTAYDKDSLQKIMSLMDDRGMVSKWELFSKRVALPGVTFQLVLTGIHNFITPVWNAIVTENELFSTWSPSNGKWE